MTSRSKKMKIQCLNSDRISSLPQDITGIILNCMTIRDAIRTSILSKNWRSGWKSMTKLVFDDKMVKVPSNCQQLKKYKLASAILNVLLLHTGSIHNVIIEVGELDVDSDFDQIICYLSRNNHLQEYCFQSLEHYYKLPSSFFPLQGLEIIELQNCIFRPPIKFDGFSKLRAVVFVNVDITSKTLQLFLSKCPLLMHLALIGGSRDFARGNKLTFVELLLCVPLIEYLDIRDGYMEYFSTGGMPHKLPTPLVYLRHLFLYVCYDEEVEVSSALCLIRSSPNLETIGLTGYDTQISKNSPDIKDYSSFALDHLELFRMKNFTNEDREVDFLKLIMAKSPMLKRARIELSKLASVEEELHMLRDLIELPFLLASPSAKLIIERPKLPHDAF